MSLDGLPDQFLADRIAPGGINIIDPVFPGRRQQGDGWHGKMSKVKVNNDTLLFKGLPEYIEAARYHSLAGDENTLPEELTVTAKTDDGEIMAVQHKTYPIYGVQFHPESILTPNGKDIIENFLKNV